MYISAVPTELRRGCHIPRRWSNKQQFAANMDVKNSGSSGVVNALNYYVISTGPNFSFKYKNPLYCIIIAKQKSR